MRSKQRVNGVFREQATGMTQVIQQIRIAGALREHGTKIVNGFAELAGFDLRDSQRFLRTGLRGIALCQESGYLHQGDVYRLLRGHYSSVFALTDSCVNPVWLSSTSAFGLVRGVFGLWALGGSYDRRGLGLIKPSISTAPRGTAEGAGPFSVNFLYSGR